MDNPIETKKKIQEALKGLLNSSDKPKDLKNLTPLVDSIRKYKAATNLKALSEKIGKLSINEARTHSHVGVITEGYSEDLQDNEDL